MGKIHQRQQFADGLFAADDFLGRRVSPLRIPIKVERSGHSEAARFAEKSHIASEKHRLRKPDVGAKEMPSARKRLQIDLLKAERCIVWMTTQEMPFAAR